MAQSRKYKDRLSVWQLGMNEQIYENIKKKLRTTSLMFISSNCINGSSHCAQLTTRGNRWEASWDSSFIELRSHKMLSQVIPGATIGSLRKHDVDGSENVI